MERTKNLKTQQVISKVRSCYGCVYLVSPRRCDWFRVHRHRESKEIPLEVMSKGCKLRIPITSYVFDSTGVVKKIVELFEGELM